MLDCNDMTLYSIETWVKSVFVAYNMYIIQYCMWLSVCRTAHSFHCTGVYNTMNVVQYLKRRSFHKQFMQIEWRENYFRNLTAKVCANLDNPIKEVQSRAMIFQSSGSFLVCRPLGWHCANICDVTTVQLSNGNVHKFHEIFTFHENASSLYFYT